jgi:hypothetical protein
MCLIINRLRTTLSSPLLDLITTLIRFLVLIIIFALVRLSIIRLYISSIMSASYMFFMFFITLLLNVPIDLRSNRRGLN